MPTPFMHLDIAEKIRDCVAAGDNGRFHHLLTTHWPAFYLGNVAVDVQSINGMPRAATHFYHLPPDPDEVAYDVMLERYPQLARPGQLPPAQAIFIAAYRAHLLLDLMWLYEIVVPLFFDRDDLGDLQQRRLIHFALLTHLNEQSLRLLPEDADDTLAAAAPQGWLPFVPDADLVVWRDMLVEQLQPGAEVQTITIYAERLGMAAETFAAHVGDPAWMQAKVFDQIPLDTVQAVLETAVPRSIDLITDYLPIPN